MHEDDLAIEREYHALTWCLDMDRMLTQDIDAGIGDVERNIFYREQVREVIRKGQHVFYVDEFGGLSPGLGCF